MKKKRNTRLTVSFADIFTGIICFAGMFYCLFLFWKDINISFSKANEEPIAVIYFKKNSAQRKLIDGNIWERLKTASPLYNGDKIRTAALSEAFAIFEDCSKIDLHENTLIQIFSTKNKSSIEFVSGSISVLSGSEQTKDNQNFEIKTGNKIISFDQNSSAIISISSQNNNQALITVTSGEVSLKDALPTPDSITTKLLSNIGIDNTISVPTTTLQTISAGASLEFETISLNQDYEKKSSEFAVTMPSSTYSVTLSKNKQTFVPFFWANSKDIQIDFAKDSSFKEILTTKTLTSLNGRCSIGIDFAKNEKAVYWRAIPLPLSIEDRASQNLAFPQGVIFINQPEEMLLLEPMTLVFGEETAQQMEQQIQTSQTNAESKILEITNSPADNIQAEQKTEQEIEEQPQAVQEVVEEKPAAEPVPAPAPAPAKAKKQATEKPAQAPAPQEPALVNLATKITSPKAGAIFTEENFMVDDPYILFSWNNIKDASSYSFELFSDNGKKLLSKTIKGNSYTMKGDDLAVLDNGSYTFTITGLATANGKEYKSKETSGNFKISLEDMESTEVDTDNLLQ